MYVSTKRLPWIWPLIILLSTTAVGITVFSDSMSPVRPFIALWFLLVCPGMALVPLLRLKKGFVQLTLAIALSFALDTMVAIVMLYTNLWSPKGGLAVLMGLCIIGAGLQLVSVYRQPLSVRLKLAVERIRRARTLMG